MSGKRREWTAEFTRQVPCRVRLAEPLSRHTTLGVGGAADLLAWLENEPTLLEARRYLDAEGIGWRVLGRGSNLLVSDHGIPGAVLKLAGRLAEVSLLDRGQGTVVIEAGGGLSLARLLEWSQERGGGGLHGLWGIPGTVGGAVRLNAGTRAGTVGDRLVEVRLLSAGRFSWVPAGSLGLGYRCSGIGPRRIVVAARLRLPLRDPREIRARFREIWRVRRATQPRRVRSAGCFFRNPAGQFAGRLIERAGCKNARVGRAFVSDVHANFIVHRGGATAADILALSHQVARRVWKLSGVRLEREVELWGEFRSASSAGRRP